MPLIKKNRSKENSEVIQIYGKLIKSMDFYYEVKRFWDRTVERKQAQLRARRNQKPLYGSLNDDMLTVPVFHNMLENLKQ